VTVSASVGRLVKQRFIQGKLQVNRMRMAEWRSHVVFRMSLLLVRLKGYALVSDVSSSVVRPVVLCRKLGKIDLIVLWNIIRKLSWHRWFCCRIQICPRRWDGATTPFSRKHDRPATPCVKDIDSPSAQQTICLSKRSGRGSFLSQWWYPDLQHPSWF